MPYILTIQGDSIVFTPTRSVDAEFTFCLASIAYVQALKNFININTINGSKIILEGSFIDSISRIAEVWHKHHEPIIVMDLVTSFTVHPVRTVTGVTREGSVVVVHTSLHQHWTSKDCALSWNGEDKFDIERYLFVNEDYAESRYNWAMERIRHWSPPPIR